MKGATSLDGLDALRPLSCPLVSVLPARRIGEKQEELEEGDPQARLICLYMHHGPLP